MIFRKRKITAQKSITTKAARRGKRVITLALDKRQKFVIGVLVLSIFLFLSEFQFGKSGIVIASFLAILTDGILYLAIKEDLKDNFSLSIFILPFFYSLAFGLFYFLIPTRLLFRLAQTTLYAVGLYSLFLSENIFTVSSIRTIALLSGARIVSFVLTLLSYFFLTNIIYSLHLTIFLIIPLLVIYTFPLIYQSLWTYNMQKTQGLMGEWAGVLTLCIVETAIVVWFWPSTPTITSLFLAGFFYMLVGLSHVWFERRLFKNVMWEYMWVGVIVFFVLLLFTPWGK
ncbi:MAG TPA: hypothetical protein VG935_01340 [Patescibacteria group bacterium]|nr:hypothetical protein [Patescibacteria group bacterium]